MAITEITNTIKDNKLINCSGTKENEKTPFEAQFKFFKKLFVVFPNILSGLVYGMPVCLNPTHALRPLRNLSLSGNCFKTSTTFLSINEKSPASKGILI